MTEPIDEAIARMPRVDEIVAGRYRVDSKLGEGGMGVVFGVHHIHIDRRYAMKILSPRLSLDEDYRVRFMREAKIMARLQHPHVVQVIDSGVHQGLLYIVMEYLQGTPLSEMVWQDKVGGLEQILHIGAEVSSALAAAHKIGLIHRDLKTDNVLIEEDPVTGKRRCVLLDFGLAFIETSDELGRLTRESDNNVAGTPLYMSPEQISSAALTSATDIYSLGCMMYELFTGETPFEGGEAVSVIKVMTRHMFRAPEPLRHKVPTIPLPLEELIMAMLSKDPTLRPDADRIVQVLRDIGHLPASGRGGALLSREERQVQNPTARDEQLADTARFTKGSPSQKKFSVLGLWGLELSESHELAMASAGFLCNPITDVDAVKETDILLVGESSIPDIEYLAQRSAVVLYVDAGAVQNAMPLLRSGAYDVVPHDASIEELIKRLERVKRRLLREQKRHKE